MDNYQNQETHNQVTRIEKRAASRAKSQIQVRPARPSSASSSSIGALSVGRRDPVTGITSRPAISGIDGPDTPGTYLSVI